MAARLNPKHDAATRDKIRASQLLNRLQAFALSEADPQTGQPVAMSRDQVAACTTLLRKVLPDLATVQHAGEGGGPLVVQVVTGVPRAADPAE